MVYNTTQHENVDCHKSSVVVIPRLLRLVLRDYFPVVILLSSRPDVPVYGLREKAPVERNLCTP